MNKYYFIIFINHIEYDILLIMMIIIISIVTYDNICVVTQTIFIYIYRYAIIKSLIRLNNCAGFQIVTC